MKAFDLKTHGVGLVLLFVSAFCAILYHRLGQPVTWHVIAGAASGAGAFVAALLGRSLIARKAPTTAETPTVPPQAAPAAPTEQEKGNTDGSTDPPKT